MLLFPDSKQEKIVRLLEKIWHEHFCVFFLNQFKIIYEKVLPIFFSPKYYIKVTAGQIYEIFHKLFIIVYKRRKKDFMVNFISETV